MASIKYTADVPANGAFMPVVSAVVSPKASTNGMVRISGNPGNMGIPSPKPAAIPNGPLMRSAQPSFNSPDVFFPSVYYTHVNDMHPGNNSIRVHSTNEVPVPATPSNRVPGVAMRGPKIGGLRQVSWPPAPQKWQNINGGA
jgi:hypothetical protein